MLLACLGHLHVCTPTSVLGPNLACYHTQYHVIAHTTPHACFACSCLSMPALACLCPSCHVLTFPCPVCPHLACPHSTCLACFAYMLSPMSCLARLTPHARLSCMPSSCILVPSHFSIHLPCLRHDSSMFVSVACHGPKADPCCR